MKVYLVVALLGGLGMRAVRQDELLRMHAEAAGGNLACDLRQVRVRPRRAENLNHGAFMEGRDCQLIRFAVTDRGQRLHILASTFNDLANVDGVSIYRDHDLVIVLLSGGDASTGYDAKFTIRDGYVRRRVVVEGESGDRETEEFTKSGKTARYRFVEGTNIGKSDSP